MQRLRNIEFDHKPNDIEVYKTAVDVVTRCEEKQVEDQMTGEVRTVWECDLDRYDSDEYIKYQMGQYKSLQDQVQQTQIGLVEVYEMLL